MSTLVSMSNCCHRCQNSFLTFRRTKICSDVDKNLNKWIPPDAGHKIRARESYGHANFVSPQRYTRMWTAWYTAEHSGRGGIDVRNPTMRFWRFIRLLQEAFLVEQTLDGGSECLTGHPTAATEQNILLLRRPANATDQQLWSSSRLVRKLQRLQFGILENTSTSQIVEEAGGAKVAEPFASKHDEPRQRCESKQKQSRILGSLMHSRILYFISGPVLREHNVFDLRTLGARPHEMRTFKIQTTLLRCKQAQLCTLKCGEA